MKKRPKSVPKAAEYFPDWDEWGVGEKVDGKMSGPWKLWRGDGTYVEESPWKEGKCHGDKHRFHDDGSKASIATYVSGVMIRILMWRTKKKTREPNFESLPKNILEIEFLYTNDGWQTTQLFRQKDGKAVDLHGKPMPEHPNSVPERAYYNSEDGQWVAGEWRLHEGENERRGLYRYWTTEGALVRIEYYAADGSTSILDARPEQQSQGNPLVSAAKAKDKHATDLAWSVGAGESPFAAIHAAYEGLTDLAKAIVRASPKPPLLADPRKPPERRGDVPEDAVYVAGLDRWVKGTVDALGRGQGTWHIWWAPSDYTFVSREQVVFENGTKTVFRDLDSRGNVEKEILYAADGSERRTRKWEYGVLEETEHLADGTTAERQYYKDTEKLEAERITKDDELVKEVWFDESGTKTGEASPSDAKVESTEDEDETAVELWRSAEAEGFVRPGLSGRAIGTWKVLPSGKADFDRVSVEKRHDLGKVAVAVSKWQKLKPLASAKKVKWKKLETWFDSAENFPFYLLGLTCPDPLAFRVAFHALWDPILHQGTISEAAGPAFRIMADIAPTVTHTESLVLLLEFFADIATRHGSLDAANTNKRLYETKKSSAKLYSKNGIEGSYFDVFQSLSKNVATWQKLAAHDDAQVRKWAVVLLCLCSSKEALETLVDRAKRDNLRPEIVYGLALFPKVTREILEPHLNSSLPLVRFCAALTWTRRKIDGSPANVLLDALVAEEELEGFDDIYLGSGSTKSDAARALTLLPPKEATAHLDRLCAVLGDSNARNALAVAGALLRLVGTSEEPNDAQKRVLSAIAESEAVWRFNVNAFELLRAHELPEDRDAIRALAKGKKPPSKKSGGKVMLSALGGPAEDDSFA